MSVYLYIYIMKRATSPSHQTLCYLSQALKVKHNSLILNLTMHSSNPYLNAFCLKDFRTVNSSSSSSFFIFWFLIRIELATSHPSLIGCHLSLFFFFFFFFIYIFWFLLLLYFYFLIFNMDWTRNLPSPPNWLQLEPWLLLSLTCIHAM